MALFEEQQIRSGLYKLDEKHSDYLYSLQGQLPHLSPISIQHFVSEVLEKGSRTMVFLTIKGISLKSDIKREVVQLYEQVYGEA